MKNHSNHINHINEHMNDSAPPKYVFCLYFLFFFIMFALCFTAGYLISGWIFSICGRPVEILAHTIAGIIGLFVFILFVSLSKLFFDSYRERNPDKVRKKIYEKRAPLLQSTMDAMGRISRGDFNIFIPMHDNDPFSEVAESVNKMARELSSMETLRQDFISNVSHEIQSPLTSIQGFAALLKSDSLTDEQRIHYLDIIETESKRLSGLSENLLKLSALESDQAPITRSEFRLDKQIESAVLLLEPQWSGKNLYPNLNLTKTVFDGDEELMSQVWINLLHNAIKFTPEGGELAAVIKSDENEIRCSISDTGIGISTEDQVHIFERFYKVDKSRDRSLGGNGLGLSLVKRIVELHGGKIDIKSEKGKGTTFTIHLPIVIPA